MITPSPFRTAEERRHDRIRKRDAVRLAAVRMFNQRGFHATSLEDVAASLGVTKPLIYHYLGTKDQVLVECVRLGLQQLREGAAQAASLPGTGLDRLRAFLLRYAEIIMDDFGRCVIRTADEALAPDSRVQFRALKAEIDHALRAMLAAAAADGSITVRDVKFTAFAFAGALNWAARWQEPGRHLPAATVARELVETLLTGVLPRL